MVAFFLQRQPINERLGKNMLDWTHSGLYAMPTLCGSAPATREWFQAFACCSFLSCRPLGPRGVHSRLSSCPPTVTLAFAIGGTARHTQHLHHPLPVEGGSRGFPVRFRYDLTGCSPPFGGSDQAQPQGQSMTRRSYAVSMKCLRQAPSSGTLAARPASRGFYSQAFSRSVTRPAAGYHYGSNWIPLPVGLSPTGTADSLAAPPGTRLHDAPFGDQDRAATRPTTPCRLGRQSAVHRSTVHP